MIILIGGIKGGCGKTTIATNLAIYTSLLGAEVLLVDADDQQTCSDFTNVRNDLHPDRVTYTSIKLSGQAVYTEVKKLDKNYDFIIIDSGGRDTSSQRAALMIADKVLIPFLPRSFDVWTMPLVVKLVNEIEAYNHRLKLYAFLNKADSTGTDNQEAEEYIMQDGNFIYLDTPIVNRKAFGNAASCGLSVMEYVPADLKARSEFVKLAYEVLKDEDGKSYGESAHVLCKDPKGSEIKKEANENKAG